MAVSRPFVIDTPFLSPSPNSRICAARPVNVGLLQSFHCLSSGRRSSDRFPGDGPPGRPPRNAQSGHDTGNRELGRARVQNSRGGGRYTGPGFRIVRCFPKMSRREADVAVQVWLHFPPNDPIPDNVPACVFGAFLLASFSKRIP